MSIHAGFTLLEMMVVVAILGLLAAIAIPQLAEYQRRSQDAAARTDLRNTMVVLLAARDR